MPRMQIEERRRRLMTATVALVAESGIQAATTRAIASRAGMPLASFHYAFASHQELMLATLHALIEAELTDFNGSAMSGDSLDACMQSELLAHLDDVVARRGDYRCLTELSLFVSHLPSHSGLPVRYRARRIKRQVGKLHAAVERLGTGDELNLPGLARTLVVAADGLTIAVLSGVDPDDLRLTIPGLVREA